MAAVSRRRDDASSFSSSSCSSSCPFRPAVGGTSTLRGLIVIALLWLSTIFTAAQGQVQVQPVVSVALSTPPQSQAQPSQASFTQLSQQSAGQSTAIPSQMPPASYPQSTPPTLVPQAFASVSGGSAIPSAASAAVASAATYGVTGPAQFPVPSAVSSVPVTAPVNGGAGGPFSAAVTSPGLIQGYHECGLPDPSLPRNALNFPFDCAATINPSLRVFWTKPDILDPVIRFGALFTAKGYIAVGFGQGMINGTVLVVQADNQARVVTMFDRTADTFDDHFENVIPLRHRSYPATIDRATLPPETTAVTYSYVTFYVYIKNTVKPLDMTTPIDMIYAFSDQPTLTYHAKNRGTFKILLMHPSHAQASASAPLMRPAH